MAKPCSDCTFERQNGDWSVLSKAPKMFCLRSSRLDMLNLIEITAH